MAIIPTVRCRRMETSIAFYTKVLDFERVDGASGAGDPSFAVLRRGGDPLFLSSHGGDGTFGQAIVVSTDDADALFRKFRARGLETPGDPTAPSEVHEGPLDQSWGTREFYVDDPDGNTLRFAEGLRPASRSAMGKTDFRSGRPESGEFASYAQADIDLVEGDDAVAALQWQCQETLALFARFGEEGGDIAYAPGKWTVKQVLGHLADDERIFAYRALCVARGDSRPLPGFDENAYASAARFENHSLLDLLADYEAVRNASVTLFRGLDREAWLRTGTVNGYAATPRGLAFHIAGHELHHHRILLARYLPLTPQNVSFEGLNRETFRRLRGRR